MNENDSGLKLKNLILASGSPRRKELLEQFGFQFQVIVPEDAVEAGVCRSLSPEKFVLEASRRKAESVATMLADAVVIAADTVAVCNGQVLGKPADRNHARQMLKTLSGEHHFVLTGVTVWHRPSDRFLSRLESAELEMQPLEECQIDQYLDSGDWVGKAGAFGYQDGHDWIQVIDGLESTVVGLPVQILGEMIRGIVEESTG